MDIHYFLYVLLVHYSLYEYGRTNQMNNELFQKLLRNGETENYSIKLQWQFYKWIIIMYCDRQFIEQFREELDMNSILKAEQTCTVYVNKEWSILKGQVNKIANGNYIILFTNRLHSTVYCTSDTKILTIIILDNCLTLTCSGSHL